MTKKQLTKELLEDIEALSSPGFLKSIDKARKAKKWYSSKETKKILNTNEQV